MQIQFLIVLGLFTASMASAEMESSSCLCQIGKPCQLLYSKCQHHHHISYEEYYNRYSPIPSYTKQYPYQNYPYQYNYTPYPNQYYYHPNFYSPTLYHPEVSSPALAPNPAPGLHPDRFPPNPYRPSYYQEYRHYAPVQPME